MVGLFSRFFGRAQPVEPAWIEPCDLKRRLAGGTVLLLDVRGAEEFSGPLGHIAGAVNVPLPDLPTHLTRLAASRRPLVCVRMTDKRSARAAAELAGAGHPDVAVLRGGMVRWRSEEAGAGSRP